ncbi:MAG: hypothetical protein WCB27_10855 [Thermoguttaceae bacterium]|jgi:hypothetical protein
MWAVKAIYDNGHLTFLEGKPPGGRWEVVVVFPDESEQSPPCDKDAGRRFVDESPDVPRRCNIDDWSDEKAAHSKEMPSE